MVEAMDAEFAKWLATLGVGGVLAGLMFMFYRKDVKQYTELWKTATDTMMLIVKENTASNTKLIQLIETQERNTLRKEDLAFLMTDKRLRSDGNN
jgi:hypothetical protein